MLNLTRHILRGCAIHAKRSISAKVGFKLQYQSRKEKKIICFPWSPILQPLQTRRSDFGIQVRHLQRTSIVNLPSDNESRTDSSTQALADAQNISPETTPDDNYAPPVTWTHDQLVDFCKVHLSATERDLELLRNSGLTGEIAKFSERERVGAIKDVKLTQFFEVKLLNVLRPLPEKLSAIVEEILGQEAKIDFQAARTKLEDAQRKKLGIFLKTAFVFNPVPQTDHVLDLRFMPTHVRDEVYTQFQRWATEGSEYKLHALRAIPGAGKTAVMLNAIGRETYMIYVMCSEGEGVSASDFRDRGFEAFDQHAEVKKLGNMQDPKAVTRRMVELLQLFWLARLMALDYLIQKFNYSPIEWLYWSNNGGQQKIVQIQDQFLNILGYPGLRTGETLIESLISKHKVWIGVDEAQIANAMFTKKLVRRVQAYNDTLLCDCTYSNLLHAMVLYSLPASSSRVVCGTRLSSFDMLKQSGDLKGTELYEITKDELEFPFVTGDEALRVIGEYINMELLEEDTRAQAKKQLEGRLRYSMRILAILAKQARALGAPLQANEVDAFFKKALQTHKQEILEYIIVKRIPHIVERDSTRSGRQLELSKQLFYSHLGSLCYESEISANAVYPVDSFVSMFGFAPEDTGVLYFSKHEGPSGYSYWYSIRENFLCELLLSNPAIQKAYYHMRLSEKLGRKSRDPGAFGTEFQELFSLGLCAILPNILAQLKRAHALPSSHWTDNVDCSSWRSFMKSEEITEITRAGESLKGKAVKTLLTKVLSAVRNSNDALFRQHLQELKDIWNARGTPMWNIFLQQISTASPADAARLVETVLKIQANRSKGRNDLLFLLLQQNNCVLSPTPSFGPDLLGLAQLPSGEKVLVVVSMSVRDAVTNEKQGKNITKLNPNNFFVWDANQKELAANEMVQHLLPKKLIQINYTAHQQALPHEVSPDQVLIHLTDEMLNEADPFLASVLKHCTGKLILEPKATNTPVV